MPPDVPETVIETLKRFVVVTYDRTSELQGVDAARRYVHAAGLLQHMKRAAFQAGHI